MKKVVIIGTQGVPARYGGFETLVENIIGDNCGPDIQYTVFAVARICRKDLIIIKGLFYDMYHLEPTECRVFHTICGR